MCKYCDFIALNRINMQINAATLQAPERHRITFRFQNEGETATIPRNERIIYESYDFFVSTDDSGGIY